MSSQSGKKYNGRSMAGVGFAGLTAPGNRWRRFESRFNLTPIGPSMIDDGIGMDVPAGRSSAGR
jgi:hypothetical protein